MTQRKLQVFYQAQGASASIMVDEDELCCVLEASILQGAHQL
jgi:hypothetical protein